MTTDSLFSLIETWHGDRPWGRVLDAGTGYHSLDWLLGLPSDGIAAVTGGASRAQNLQSRLKDRLRPTDELLTGNWRDPGFLAGRRFDAVVADYLLGAIDGFAPYFQGRLFSRLAPHVGGRLYVVGLEPYPHDPATEDGRLVNEIARLRDACILLAGHRCYREYPMDWVIHSLEGAGYRVVEAQSVAIVYRERFVNGQLDVCLRKLPFMKDPNLAAMMRNHIEALRARALRYARSERGIRFGQDYVVCAELA